MTFPFGQQATTPFNFNNTTSTAPTVNFGGSTMAGGALFGNNPATSFGTAPSTSTGFSSFGFGNTTTTAPSVNFAGATPSTGGLFAANKPATGFGAAPAASAPFNFGAKPAVSFGTTTTTASTGFGSTFGGFGTTTTATTAPSSGFGIGTGSSVFGTSTASTGFGASAFGTSTANTSFTTPAFGTGTTGFGAPNTAFGAPATGFGSNTTGFGAPATGFGTASTGFGSSSTGFGTSTGFGQPGPAGLSTGFGQQQQQHPQAQQQQSSVVLANMVTALSTPVLFGDDKDALMARWNQLQALWGTGKGYFNQAGQFVTFTPDNPFCRFKAVGYSRLPSSRNEDGLVGLQFGRKQEEIDVNRPQIITTLHRLLGGKQDISVCVESVRSLPDDKTELVIFVQERPANTAMVQRVAASKLLEALLSPQLKSQLASQLCIEEVFSKAALGQDQLKAYLATPPAGIDPVIWEQAKLDNPDSTQLIPVPMIGFQELLRRLKHQDQQTRLHQARLDVISTDLGQLQQSFGAMQARLEQSKKQQLELAHRVLKVLVAHEIGRKQGVAIHPEEERFRIKLDALQLQLNTPTQFKGRINEMMSHLRLQHQYGVPRQEAAFQLDDLARNEIRQHLVQQQEGISHLISIIKEDMNYLDVIEKGQKEVAAAALSHYRQI